MSFEEELLALLERSKEAGTPFEELQYYVKELHHRHNREIPPPITGSIETIEPADSFGG